MGVHRTSVYAQAATGAGVYFSFRKTFAGFSDFEAGVAEQYQDRFSKYVHIPGKRHGKEEQAKANGIGPPCRHEIKFIAEECLEQPVYRLGQKTSSAEVCCKAFC